MEVFLTIQLCFNFCLELTKGQLVYLAMSSIEIHMGEEGHEEEQRSEFKRE